jgi:hypothetical protein
VGTTQKADGARRGIWGPGFSAITAPSSFSEGSLEATGSPAGAIQGLSVQTTTATRPATEQCGRLQGHFGGSVEWQLVGSGEEGGRGRL